MKIFLRHFLKDLSCIYVNLSNFCHLYTIDVRDHDLITTIAITGSFDVWSYLVLKNALTYHLIGIAGNTEMT